MAYAYAPSSLDRLSQLLERSVHSHGVAAFSVQAEAMPLHFALDAAGPLLPALVMHAQVLLHLSGIKTGNVTAADAFPFTFVQNDSPYGSEVVHRAAPLAFAVAHQFMDTCLEHAVCLGKQYLGYSPEEWQQLPEMQRVVPIEPYFANLMNVILRKELESSRAEELLTAWPASLDHKLLSKGTSDDQSERPQAIRFPSAR